MDIRKDFTDTFNLLKKNKKIAIPIALSIILPLVLIPLFLNLSGVQPWIKEVVIASEEFDNQKTDYLLDTKNIKQDNYSDELINYLGKDADDSKYEQELDEYLEEQGIDFKDVKKFLTLKNLQLLTVFLLIGIVAWFFFTCMSYSIIALALKKKDTDLSNVLQTASKFVFRFLLLKIVLAFIFVAPLIVLIALMILFFIIHPMIGVLSILISIPAIIFYYILLCFRMFYTTPSMFLEDKGPIDTLKNSWQVTKGHLKEVVIVFLVIYGISLFINTFVGSPLQASYSVLLFQDQVAMALVNLIIVSVLVVLKAFILTFQHIFLFQTYIDIKRGNKDGRSKSRKLR